MTGDVGDDIWLEWMTDVVTLSNRCFVRERRGGGACVSWSADQIILRSTVSYTALMSRNASTGSVPCRRRCICVISGKHRAWSSAIRRTRRPPWARLIEADC